eukprot:TRINITY_DN128_c0_g2_i1.p1 TRINITY_DN128_c0_g2~~TRINITY_DN128_c0_g2_i1.p1  ORF type:complete len:295 (-),score=56.32 TRINITY_DN128_c0_g2_i1:74-958(-)
MSTNRRAVKRARIQIEENTIREEDEGCKGSIGVLPKERVFTKRLGYFKGDKSPSSKGCYKINNITCEILKKTINKSHLESSLDKLSNGSIRRAFNCSVVSIPKPNIADSKSTLFTRERRNLINKLSTSKIYKEILAKQAKVLKRSLNMDKKGSLEMSVSSGHLSPLKNLRAPSRNTKNTVDFNSKFIKNFATSTKKDKLSLIPSNPVKQSKAKSNILCKSMLQNRKVILYKHRLLQKHPRVQSLQCHYSTLPAAAECISLLPKLLAPILVPLKLRCGDLKMWCGVEPRLEEFAV